MKIVEYTIVNESGRSRQTERHTDRQADRQTHRQTGRQTHRQTQRHTDRETHTQTDRKTEEEVFLPADRMIIAMDPGSAAVEWIEIGRAHV